MTFACFFNCAIFMSTDVNIFCVDDLGSAIVHNPLVVKAEASVIEAIALMSESRDSGMFAKIRASCVLVVEGEKVLGILTESDVVSLIAQQRSLETLTMQAVMTSPVIAIQETECVDLTSLIEMMQQKHIRHLPILDDSDRLMGLVTIESLWQEIHSSSQLFKKSYDAELKKSEQRFVSLKATEQALKFQRDLNQLIAEITSRFIDISPDCLDEEIDRSLQLIGEATNSDTSYLIKFLIREQDESPLPEGTGSMTHEWTKPKYPRQIEQVQNVPLSVFPWANVKLLQREVVNISRVVDLPSEAMLDQANWQQFNLVSILMVPLIQKSVVTGSLGFASFSERINWDEEIIRLLQVMAQTIANAQQRAQDEQQLYESEERLRLALRAANQGLYDLNLQTGEAIVSLEYATMLGYNPATFQENNARWIERLHPDDCAHVTKVYQDYVAGLSSEYKVEFRQLTQTGEWKWILSLGRIVAWDESGNPLRMLGTHTDISDRKKAAAEQLLAEQVRQELKFLENILDIVLAGYWDWDLQTNEEYLSKGFKQMFGYEDDELPNSLETWQHLIFDEDLPMVFDCFDRHVQSHGKVPFYNEVRYRHKDGSTVWVNCSGKVIEWDQEGKPLRMIGCHIDITKQKQAENRLRKSDIHLKTAQRIGRLGSWEFILDPEQVIWSDELFHIFGRDRTIAPPNLDELHELLHPDDRDHHQQAVQTAIATGQPFDIEFRFFHQDGSIRYSNPK